MPMHDEEMARLCRERFGTALDAEGRARLIAQAETLARIADALTEAVDPASEPGGHAALLREARHDG